MEPKATRMTRLPAMILAAGRGAERERESGDTKAVSYVSSDVTSCSRSCIPKVVRIPPENADSGRLDFIFNTSLEPALVHASSPSRKICILSSRLPLFPLPVPSFSVLKDTFLSFGWSCARKTTTKPTSRWRIRSAHISTTRERLKSTCSK